LPAANPVTDQTLNYTVVAVGIIALGAGGTWVIWAHRWFISPVAEIAETMRLGVDVSEPEALENKKVANSPTATGESRSN
jgi:hypothetical protein